LMPDSIKSDRNSTNFVRFDKAKKNLSKLSQKWFFKPVGCVTLCIEKSSNNPVDLYLWTKILSLLCSDPFGVVNGS
jgi:hypothetical protein